MTKSIQSIVKYLTVCCRVRLYGESTKIKQETKMPHRAHFQRMEDSTQQDWQLIGGEFMQFAKKLPDRVIQHLQLLEGLRRFSD
jgi:hypothetical protein